nr:MAG TPA: hypothetical protein [Caudoviricetes sp.]
MMHVCEFSFTYVYYSTFVNLSIILSIFTKFTF